MIEIMLAFVISKHKVASINSVIHQQKRPTRIPAGGAFLCVEAWLSGLLHRAYPSADVWASNPLTVHGVIVKTVAVTDLRQSAAHRYSPAEVVMVSREAVRGVPAQISTSYVERSNLSIRMASRRFTQLTNGFSKKLENHAAAVSLYVAHYNFCLVHESLTPDARHQNTPAMALGIAKHVWSIGELLDAAVAVAPVEPTETARDRRRRFRIIEGGKK